MRPTVKVDELLTILKANRAVHRTVFEAALEGWQRQARVDVERIATDLAAGRYPKISLNLPLPADHTRDYDRVIRMVTLHQGEEIVLSEEDAAQYIEDDWQWKRQWLSHSSTYAAKSVFDNYGDDW
jgi:hypothetical protein